MRTFFYPNEYKRIIEQWNYRAKTLNPFKRRHAKQMAKCLTEELLYKYPEVKGMSDKMQDIYLEEETIRFKKQLGIIS